MLWSFSLSGQDWVNPQLFSGFEYRSVGPTRGGRATTVTGHPAQPSTFYQGATGGGVWKTTDYGQTWKNVSDGFFATPSIGAIRMAPSNPEIVYVGTGSDGIRSNVISGKGVYKSTDGGKKWSFLGLEKTGQIGAVEIHPTNPDVAFVAAIGNAFAANPERGIYRTQDGGKSWEKVLYLSDTTGFADLEFHPTQAQVIYAAAWRGQRLPWTIISGGKEGGIYKSTDGGDSWQLVSKGLPGNLIGKIDLAVTPAAPNRVYALVEAPEGEGGLYRSEDAGETWTLQSTNEGLLDRPFYYCNVDVDPQNSDIVYVNATSFWRSTDGGVKWQRLSTPHGDNHDIWINPNDSNLWVQCNDGGAAVTRDGGKTWSTQENQPTAELYQVEVDDQFPYWLYAGQQDNSTIAVPSLPPFDAVAGPNSFWMAVGGCETGPAVPKPGDPFIVYSNCKGRFGLFDKRTGQERQYYVGAANIYGHKPEELTYRFQRVAPISVSPHNPNVVYHGSQYVHRTTDGGITWQRISPDLTAFEPDKQVISGSPITRDVTGEEYYSTLYEINESPKQAGVIWAGANDGPIHVTRDNGKNWQNVTPSGLAPGGRVDCIDPSPHKAGKAYAAILRYQLDDWRPYIYRTTDFGKTWKLITQGIPADYPVRVVREDPHQEGLLYAGTEYGLFISFDDGEHWHSFQQNLPVTPVTDLKIKNKDLVISTMGRGFWILDNISAIYEMGKEVAAKRQHLFQPADQYRLRHRGNREDSPSYPNPQATIDYYLAAPLTGEITLEILDSQNKLVRSFTSARPPKPGENAPEQPSMATGFSTPGFSADLKKTAGFHRFGWDMRYESPRAGGGGFSRGGVLAAPGTYTVRMTMGGETAARQFRLLPDPRLAATGVTAADIQAQVGLSLQVAELERRARELDAAAQATAKNKMGRTPEQQERLEKVLSGLNTADGRYMTPMLLDQISYLRSMLDQADQRPGKDALDRYQELKKWYNQIVETSKGVKLSSDAAIEPLR